MNVFATTSIYWLPPCIEQELFPSKWKSTDICLEEDEYLIPTIDTLNEYHTWIADND